MSHPRIALVHATPLAVEPIKTALAQDWQEAEVVNVIDDSLSTDRETSIELTDSMFERIVGLARYARRIGSDGVIFTCSAFGPAIEEAAKVLDIPVLKPNEAMFEAAVEIGGSSAMIATFRPAQASMEAEFDEQRRRAGSDATLTTFVVEEALTALRAGDAATHNRLIAQTAGRLLDYDTILLAHFSTSRAAPLVGAAIRSSVLTAPGTAVAKLRKLIESTAGRAR